MKKLMPYLLILLLYAGCQLNPTNPFVGTWIGHGELIEENTPSPGVTRVTTLDDVVAFKEDMTFLLDQGLRITEDGVVVVSVFQKGTGVYSSAGGFLTLTFDPSSDPSLTNDTPSYEFSADWQTITIQPTTITFPLVFKKAW